jgi:hypothetical protein
VADATMIKVRMCVFDCVFHLTVLDCNYDDARKSERKREQGSVVVLFFPFWLNLLKKMEMKVRWLNLGLFFGS